MRCEKKSIAISCFLCFYSSGLQDVMRCDKKSIAISCFYVSIIFFSFLFFFLFSFFFFEATCMFLTLFFSAPTVTVFEVDLEQEVQQQSRFSSDQTLRLCDSICEKIFVNLSSPIFLMEKGSI